MGVSIRLAFVTCTLLAVAALPVSSLTASAWALEANGLAIERAIVIQASNTRDGIAAEYAYVGRTYPGWRRTRQALLTRGDRRYDVLTIVSPSGETRDVFFDITNFFGRM